MSTEVPEPQAGQVLPMPALRMPGATLVTRLKVYDTITPDGQFGGTPHMHLLCSEMYFVTTGSGFVEMIDWQGFSRVELKSSSVLVFSPGTIHRLINPNKDLELFIVMQNSGLPERGDNVVSFTDDILSTEESYKQAMTVKSFDDAYLRRDKGVEGFNALKASFEEGLDVGQNALRLFHERAAERTSELRSSWESVIATGPLKEAQISLNQVSQLATSQLDYLQQAQHFLIEAQAFKTPGFCGSLNRYFDPATLELEGIIQKDTA